MSELRAVRIAWVDSVRLNDGWESVEHYRAVDTSKKECVTLGWLVRDDEEGVIVALSRSADREHVVDGIFIPRVSIVEQADWGEG